MLRRVNVRRRSSRASAFSLPLIAAGLLALNAAQAAAQGPPSDLPGRGPVVLEGELDVVYEDDDERGVARLVHFLHTDNRRVPLRFEGGSAPDLPTGSRVRVSGNLAEGTVTTTTVTTLATSTTRTMGPQNVLVILFNFTGNATEPWTSTTIASVNDQVKNYYLENTYGQTILSFTVAGWFTISASTNTCDYSSWATQAEAAATSAGFNLSAYDRRIFAFPRVSACSWTGMGNVGGPRSWLNGSYNMRTTAHEQGHNFGNHHSKSTQCDSPSTCTTVEYGDDRDVLGVSGVVGHMNAFQKERLGWLNYGTSPGIRTVTGTGDYWIDNYEMLGGPVKALKIANPATGGYYYVESRARMGFDANVGAGVTLHSVSGSIGYQLDLAQTTTTYDSTLDVDQVFTDSALGLTIQTLSSSVDGALIRIGSTTTTTPCTTQAPAVSMAAAGQMRFTVTVRNNNGSSCAASAFNISATVPSGWSASFSPATSPSLTPGASASTSLTLSAPSGTSGTYPFSVTAVDASSGASASATGSVVLVTSLNVTASASVSGNGGNKSATVAVRVTAGSQASAGATVSVAVTNPKGVRSTLTATSDGSGNASVKVPVKPKDPTGVYQVQVTATSGGATGQAATSFTIQ
jgi:hypothetical protein